jgi:hypothetical protein
MRGLSAFAAVVTLSIVGCQGGAAKSSTPTSPTAAPSPYYKLKICVANTQDVPYWIISTQDTTVLISSGVFLGAECQAEAEITYDSRDSLHVSVQCRTASSGGKCSPVFSQSYGPQYDIKRPPAVSFDPQKHVPERLRLLYDINCGPPMCSGYTYTVQISGDYIFWPTGTIDWGSPNTWSLCGN